MHVYRIARIAHKALDGEGAREYGGRWNSPGRAMVYTSATLSLAALEYLVHIDPEDAPDDLVAMTIEIPETPAIQTISIADLPAGWEQAADIAVCKKLGDAWLESGKGLTLRVPSAPIPTEHNYLLNPGVAAMKKVKVLRSRAFMFDPRLL